jgi:hypothetical protein
MKTLVAAALLSLGICGTAQAQMMNNPPPAAPPAQAAQFSPDAQKAPMDVAGLNASVRANNDAWDHQDVDAILNAWVFPATVFTTDAAGTPSYVQTDAAAARAAFSALFASVPKPGPGQRAAEIKFAGQKIEWVSHTLAVVSHSATLSQGVGKAQFKRQWKVTQVWTREPAGWRVRGYVASGWADLFRH